MPTMVSCRGIEGYRKSRWLSQDDEAAYQFLTNRSGTYHAATANPSFEESQYLQYWGLQNVTAHGRYSGGQDGTPYYVSFKGSASNTAIYSTTRITDGGELDWITGRANYRKSYPYDTGHVTIVAKYREVDFPSSPKCGDPATFSGNARDISYDSVSFSNYYYSKTCYPGVGWGYCTTSGTNPPTRDAYDGRIVVYNRMKAPAGNYTYVAVDRVRLLAKD